ncbi:hypothetical protein WBG78_02635 [Chryseolinea sp. T2]|uniref:hypothetical protein n=1 Tax=Chryseolinea sp. T2 TaxID=3129255 RepID=UPI0030773635
MPKIRNNVVVQGASGKLGDNVCFRRLPNGETIIANKPKKREKLSDQQVVVVDRFSDATYYAKHKTRIPEFKTLYKRGINKEKLILSAYNVAVRDFLNAPIVEAIDVKDYSGRPGQLIRARATDDFKVMSVTITITDSNNKVIEKGEMTARGKKGLWRYSTTVKNLNVEGTMITVVANDLPGNATKETLTIVRFEEGTGLMVTETTIKKEGETDKTKEKLTTQDKKLSPPMIQSAPVQQESEATNETLGSQQKDDVAASKHTATADKGVSAQNALTDPSSTIQQRTGVVNRCPGSWFQRQSVRNSVRAMI